MKCSSCGCEEDEMMCLVCVDDVVGNVADVLRAIPRLRDELLECQQLDMTDERRAEINNVLLMVADIDAILRSLGLT